MKIWVVNEHSEGYCVSVEPTGDFRLIGLGEKCELAVSGGAGDAEIFVYVSKKRICVSDEYNQFQQLDITTDDGRQQ